MKYLIALAFALAVSSTSAQIGTISTALTVGQWVVKNSKKVYHVRVEAKGDSPKDARTNAYRKAIELAVGTLILGQSEVVNDRLVRNEIIAYSSGYVDDFKIISESGNTVVMDVWVSESKIANRLEAVGISNTAKVNSEGIRQGWERHKAQEETANARQSDAYELNKAVLDDYPRMAFNVKPLGSKMVFKYNKPIFTLRYEVGMDQRYVDSLKEVLLKTKSGGIIKTVIADDLVQIEQPWFNFSMGFWTDPRVKPLWEDTFFQRKTFLKVTLDHTRWHCWPLDSVLNGSMFGTIPNSKTMVVNSRRSEKVDLEIYAESHESYDDFVTRISSIGIIDAKVVDKNECFS